MRSIKDAICNTTRQPPNTQRCYRLAAFGILFAATILLLYQYDFHFSLSVHSLSRLNTFHDYKYLKKNKLHFLTLFSVKETYYYLHSNSAYLVYVEAKVLPPFLWPFLLVVSFYYADIYANNCHPHWDE